MGPNSKFREALDANGILISDGGMGTALHAKGLAYGNSFDELNLSRPEWVREVHQDFINAGARIIQTNTFGANRQRLGTFGLASKVQAINQAGAQIARAAAGVNAFVAGSVGPLGVVPTEIGVSARDIFREQIAALTDCGIDLLILETFRHLSELRKAIFAAREVAGDAGDALFVIAQVSVEENGDLADGATIEHYTRALDDWPIDAMGINCSSGPQITLETIRKMHVLTRKPLSAMPNAGLPINGVYPCSPKSFGEYARKLMGAGACIVGGCCGVTAQHLQAIKASRQ